MANGKSQIEDTDGRSERTSVTVWGHNYLFHILNRLPTNELSQCTRILPLTLTLTLTLTLPQLDTNSPLLRNPKVRHRVQNSPQHVPIFSQINPIHALQSYIFKIHFNISHLRLGLPSGGLALSFPHQNPACIFPLHYTTTVTTSTELSRLPSITVLI